MNRQPTIDDIHRVARQVGLPVPVRELGRGSRGAAYETTDPEVVLKYTRDSGEAWLFALRHLGLLRDGYGFDALAECYGVALMTIDGVDHVVLWKERARRILSAAEMESHRGELDAAKRIGIADLRAGNVGERTDGSLVFIDCHLSPRSFVPDWAPWLILLSAGADDVWPFPVCVSGAPPDAHSQAGRSW